MEKTFLMIKPEIIERGEQDEIIDILAENGFSVLRMKKFRFDDAKARSFYSVHRGEPFFEGLLTYIMSGPVIGLELERLDAIVFLRKLVGQTDPADAEPGTIRRIYGTDLRHNGVHASDSPESAKKELDIVFSED